MLRAEADLNEACRGGSGDDPKTLAACAKRDALIVKLNAAGWCYGPPDLPMYQQKWAPCPSSGSRPAVAPSAPIEPAQVSDRVAFDRASAVRDGKVQAYMAAADSCMHRKAEAALYASVKSREQIRRQVYASCTTTVIGSLQADAGLTREDAETGVQAMVDRAVEDVLAAYGN